ncbi:MAG: hypothetical protein ACRDAP_00010 [Shewanella sp.]
MYQNIKTGECVHAIRGTQESQDFITDVKMAFGGGVDQFGYADRMLQEWEGRWPPSQQQAGRDNPAAKPEPKAERDGDVSDDGGHKIKLQMKALAYLIPAR